jgi:hypothetical protein
MKSLLKYFNHVLTKFDCTFCEWSWYVPYNHNTEFKNIPNKKIKNKPKLKP